MSQLKSKYPFFSAEAAAFLVLAILTLTILFNFVDLTPHVDSDFFFSSDDPNYQADAKISKLFKRKDSQIIISISGNIFSAEYQKKIHRLTGILSELDFITNVKSITAGPKNVKDALQSPFWRRALIAENQESSNIIIIVSNLFSPTLVEKIEQLTSAMQAPDFQIRISGFPYIVELIQRSLITDLNVFSKLAFILLSITIIMIFHSWRILLGMIVTCSTAGALSLMLHHLLGFKIGILTANLTTIIFVITLSHIVFLTFNWKNLYHPSTNHDQIGIVKEAMTMTISASFWSMLTTLLGFSSLFLVQAKPLRELGVGGAIGTIVAFISTYTIFPSFLRLKELSTDWAEKEIKSFYHKTFRLVDKNYSTVVILILGIVLISSPSLWHLDTDPSLLSYFSKNSDIFNGLSYIDENGGSSPLVVTVQDNNNRPLDTNKMYRRLWRLQQDLENHPEIGTVIALPTLLAEAKRRPLSFFISSKSLLSRLSRDKYDNIASSFITEDRKSGLFLFRMKEEGRRNHRLDVIKQIEGIIHQHQFTPSLVGGIYSLQGHLSRHIAVSLIYGLGRLILIFMFIALIAARSLRIAFAMTFSICLIPLCILGGVGYFKIPLDTISAPAANVAIAMGIDAMIHMAYAYRRMTRRGKHHWDDWVKVRRKMWEPIITSMTIVCAGFGIFFFSSFPPTQRFGGAIVFGTIISSMTALFIFPLIAKK